jgi:hypothetical protein
MFHDIQNQLMVKQAFTTGATLSTDVYDLGKEGIDISIGEMFSGLIVATTAPAGTVTATSYTLEVLQSSAANMSSPDVLVTKSVLPAALAVDRQVTLTIEQGSISKRYLSFRVTAVGGTAPTVTLSGFLVPTKEIAIKDKYFPKVYSTI